ncbi:hypothetical protein PRIEUP_LOCUS12134, partial [Pristimantis euphronides]
SIQQVLLLPRVIVTSVRAESGGKSSPDTGISKTLVSFPVKVSHFQQPASGENRYEPPRPEKAALLDVGELGGQSEREIQLGQEVSQDNAQHLSGTSHKDDDSSSSSSSSSDSSSDSESEGEDKEPVTDLQVNKGENDGGYKGLPSAAQKSSSSPDHVSLEKEHPIAEEQKNGMGMRGANAEDLQDFAPVVSTEEQSLHTTLLPTKMIPTGADEMETADGTVPNERASSTAAVDSEEIKILSTSEELPTGGVMMLTPESGETQLLSTTTSEEFSVESLKMLAPESREILIQLSSTSEELPTGGVEMSSLECIETQIISPATSEELPAGVVETLAPESMDSQIFSTTTSEELPAGVVETLAPEFMDSQILSTTTCEELPAEEGAAELHESSEDTLLLPFVSCHLSLVHKLTAQSNMSLTPTLHLVSPTPN